MFLAVSEGWHWRYEVCEHADGYLVQMRDLETGDLDEDFSTVFRTMPVAFAYAEMSAAYERYVATEGEEEDAGETGLELATTERHFVDLSDRLGDSGVHGVMVAAWEQVRPPAKPRVIH
ncbi:hypothetical protein [Microvirga brassicacearum]|uniref:Uncharacterized protein n=1 Tax=Microvirga brassicacearum TaxID=2580413 RepID=A0A5N3PEP3_9HYPH|nr:hypothetical protein [Microvirga brassicacearum]KAB0268174.1 hypothetical protein FEZ63_06000 [Microvirga brassicacearum]